MPTPIPTIKPWRGNRETNHDTRQQWTK
jgi:hypothetical protein